MQETIDTPRNETERSLRIALPDAAVREFFLALAGGAALATAFYIAGLILHWPNTVLLTFPLLLLLGAYLFGAWRFARRYPLGRGAARLSAFGLLFARAGWDRLRIPFGTVAFYGTLALAITPSAALTARLLAQTGGKDAYVGLIAYLGTHLAATLLTVLLLVYLGYFIGRGAAALLGGKTPGTSVEKEGGR